jgi:hypothetical protein
VDLPKREPVNGVDQSPVDGGSQQGVASQFSNTSRHGSRNHDVNRSGEKLTCTISTKLTKAEDERLRAYAEAQGSELSTFVRATLLAAIQGKSLRSPSVMHLEIFVRTVEAWLELGNQFSLEKFREICQIVTAKGSMPLKPSVKS